MNVKKRIGGIFAHGSIFQEEDLDCPQGVIDFSLYLRSSTHISTDPNNEEQGDNMTTVLDQKNYIEELNRHLK